jgi:predicted AlkP superfamily pyrophosphatase or phosphodiesterase
MKLLRSLCAATLVACGISFHFAAGPASAAGAPSQKDRMIIVISLDGFPAYALDDPRLPIPTLRKLAREGASATSMKPVNPTVTWPNHTAIVTGVDASQHGVLYNGILSFPGDGGPPKIEPWRDKEVMVHAPTIYDLAHNAGLTTAQVDWVAIYRAKTITWQFPELPDPDGEIERDLIDAGTVTREQLRTFEDSAQAWQDQIWTAAAEDILEKHKPNLLLFHLLTGDDTNHEYAPMSHASMTAFAFLDDRVKQILDLLERTGLSKRATLMIVSDHGFRTFKHKIHPNVLLRKEGLLTGGADRPKGDAWVVPEGGTAMVYANNSDRKADIVARLRRVFAGAEGIDRVYGPDEFSALGLPTRATNEQAPDLVLAATPEYAVGAEADGPYITEGGDAGTHGYVNSDPKMQAIFIAWGVGIPKGIKLGTISNLDVAPTIATLLGLRMEHVQGNAIQPLVQQQNH